MTTTCNPCQISDSGCVPECKESEKEPTYREVTELFKELDCRIPNVNKYTEKEKNFLIAYIHRNIDLAIKLYRELKGE